jgi:hypothetical protein
MAGAHCRFIPETFQCIAARRQMHRRFSDAAKNEQGHAFYCKLFIAPDQPAVTALVFFDFLFNINALINVTTSPTGNISM